MLEICTQFCPEMKHEDLCSGTAHLHVGGGSVVGRARTAWSRPKVSDTAERRAIGSGRAPRTARVGRGLAQLIAPLRASEPSSPTPSHRISSPGVIASSGGFTRGICAPCLRERRGVRCAAGVPGLLLCGRRRCGCGCIPGREQLDGFGVCGGVRPR
ncbi:hypothetical protein BV25DRAFT_909368 [Artomyces pyxidatus]|uniref:Uncharacterized protein n=1 Tax=Artomyces pyxidatus TaxID=48021 RepID=A0ACB8SY36_9AGAM|nr:hypothetical protein BV25DRAFT_909368 [Artomyces pyxidatus]